MYQDCKFYIEDKKVMKGKYKEIFEYIAKDILSEI